VNIKPNYLEGIIRLDVEYAHPSKEKLDLLDIYVYPDLRKTSKSSSTADAEIDGERLSQLSDGNPVTLIVGAEQGGCTSFAKRMYVELYTSGFLPVYAKMPAASKVRILNRITRSITEQYDGGTTSYYSGEGLKVLILDDFEVLASSNVSLAKLLEEIGKGFDQIFLFADERIQFDEGLFMQLSTYPKYTIQPFGNKKRAELIERWSQLGDGATLSEGELLRQVDRVTRNVNLVVRRNLIPRTPIFILSVIQQLHSFGATDLSLTSFGHCYQSLIVAALARAGIKPQELDQYLNYLSELAYFIYQQNERGVGASLISEFKARYESKYFIVDHKEVMDRLEKARIIAFEEDVLSFGYPYIYYFYVAKRLSDSFPSDEASRMLDRLLESLYVERSAHILIFITHHSRDERIIRRILDHARAHHREVEPAKLSRSETEHLLQHFAAIPELVYRSRDARVERRQRLEQQDAIDAATEEEDQAFEEQSGSEPSESADEYQITYRELASSARAVEVIGQITRNRFGSLEYAALTELFDEATNVGFRVVRQFLEALEEHQEAVLEYISSLFEKNSKLSKQEAIQETQRIYMLYCHSYLFSVISKLSVALGCEELVEYFKSRQSDIEASIASRLMYTFILLEFGDAFPEGAIADLYSDMEGNEIPRRLLKQAVLRHLYIHKVDFRQRQRLEHSIGLKDAVSVLGPPASDTRGKP